SSELTREGLAVHATQLGKPSPVSRDEARPHIVDMLDSIRRQQEALNVDRPRYMLLARKYGLKHREIAELLGMTESGVRQAVHRAKDTPGMEFGGAA
ncbi:sigma factor-like helix-turn-helix DNA-binding protein, partial [Nocardia fusca]